METTKSYNNQVWFLAVILFCMTNPCYLWQTPIPVIAVMLFYLVAVLHSEAIGKKLLIGSILFFLFYVMTGVRYGFSLSFIFTIAIPSILLINKQLLCDGFEKFIIILSVTMTLSLIVYVLMYFFGISFPYVTVPPLNPLKAEAIGGYVYEMYPFLIVEPIERGFIQRFHGMYDEPGVVGTMCAIILVAKNFNIRKIVYLPIFLGALFSFSLYFFVIAIVYFIITIKKKNFIGYAIFAAILLYAISFIPGIEELVYARFIIEDGTWQGNSRESLGYGAWFSRFRETSDYWFGLGPGAHLVPNPSGASYKDIIVDNGIILFIFYISSWAVFIFGTQKGIRNIILVSIVIFGCIFQRPFITDVFMQLSFLYLIFEMVKANNNSKHSSLYELSKCH